MKFRIYSIRWKLFIAVGIPLVLIYLTLLAIAFHDLRKDATSDMNHYMAELATHYAQKFDVVFSGAAQVARTTAGFLSEDIPFSEASVYQLLQDNVSGNPAVYGSAAAFEEGAFPTDKKLFGPYVCRNLSKDPNTQDPFREINIGENAYDYRKWDWYRLPKEKRQGLWTEPYLDQGAGNVIMSTYSTPIVKNGKFQGVATVDIRVQDIQAMLETDGLVSKDSFVIISHEGRYISHPKPEYILNETVFSNAQLTSRPELLPLGKKMIAGEKGSALIKDFRSPKKIFLFYAPIPSTGWSFAATVPEEEIMLPVWQQLARFGLSMLAGLFVMMILLLIIASKITKPVIEFSNAAKKIGAGNFDLPLKSSYGKDEFGDLAESFKKMAKDLKEYTEALTRETANRQRVESELQLARNIQLSLLPKAFPVRKEFVLYAKNDPARYVAGDFFDCFFTGKDTLAFTIADVSGKGIPAAMFMVITRTLLRNLASQNKSPSEVLNETNRILVEQNDSGMFVTLFLGYYHIPSGEVCYANAGHHLPLCMNPSGMIRKFGTATGAPLGISEAMKYTEGKDSLQPNETLILFTDGFPEARTSSGEFLNEDRFGEFLKDQARSSVEELCKRIFAQVWDFQQQKLADDLTILALRRLS